MSICSQAWVIMAGISRCCPQQVLPCLLELWGEAHCSPSCLAVALLLHISARSTVQSNRNALFARDARESLANGVRLLNRYLSRLFILILCAYLLLVWCASFWQVVYAPTYLRALTILDCMNKGRKVYLPHRNLFA